MYLDVGSRGALGGLGGCRGPPGTPPGLAGTVDSIRGLINERGPAPPACPDTAEPPVPEARGFKWREHGRAGPAPGGRRILGFNAGSSQPLERETQPAGRPDDTRRALPSPKPVQELSEDRGLKDSAPGILHYRCVWKDNSRSPSFETPPPVLLARQCPNTHSQFHYDELKGALGR